jgi:hypothetical protein
MAVTPSNTVNFVQVARSLYTGSGGDIKVRMSTGEDVVFAGTPAGAVLPIQVYRVFATGTAATNIVALF